MIFTYHFNTVNKVLEKSKIAYIYEAATSGTSIEDIFELLKAT